MNDTKKIDWSKYPYCGGDALTRGEEKLLTQEEVDKINESFTKMNEEIIKIKGIFKRVKTQYELNYRYE